jgi:branched-chain amino acid transport system substrate-binding protein
MTFHQGALSWLGLGKLLCTILVASLPLLSSAAPKPVLVGLDAELGFKGSTSAEAIRQGMQLAIDDINQRGGVMGGRPLQLVERANNTIPARSIANIREFAQMPDLVAVFCGRFSPTVLESIPVIHSLQVPLLIPWGAANAIVDNGRKPNFVFRLSLRDFLSQSSACRAHDAQHELGARDRTIRN